MADKIEKVIAKRIPDPSLPERATGKIIQLNKGKGWGFIVSHDIPFTRIFFHWSGLKANTIQFPDLQKGMEVEFTPARFEDVGIRALYIVILKKEQPSESATTDVSILPEQG